METLLTIWTPYFNFFWPHLELLHNPPSEVHWIKALSALQTSRPNSGKPPLQPCIILAAARYGLARLGRRQALGELVLVDLLDPVSEKGWQILWEEDDTALAKLLKIAKLQYRDKKGQDLSWRPPGYEQISMDHTRTTLDASLLREAGLELAHERLEIYWYFEDLVQEHRRIYNVHRKINRAELGIYYKVLYLKTLDEKDRECYICHEDFLDPVKYLGPLAEAACEQPKLANLGYAFMECPPYVDEWTDKLRSSCVRDPLNMDLWDRMTMQAVKRWAYGLTSARYQFLQLTKDAPSDGCSTPVKVSCGHYFGFACIDMWLEQSWTCPYCRADLRTRKPARRPLTGEVLSQGSPADLDIFLDYLPTVLDSPADIQRVTDVVLTAIAGRSTRRRNSTIRGITEWFGGVVVATDAGSRRYPNLVPRLVEHIQQMGSAEQSSESATDDHHQTEEEQQSSETATDDQGQTEEEQQSSESATHDHSQTEEEQQINLPSHRMRRLMNRAMY